MGTACELDYVPLLLATSVISSRSRAGLHVLHTSISLQRHRELLVLLSTRPHFADR